MPLLSSAQLAAMASSVRATLLADQGTNSRTGARVALHVIPSGQTELGGDGRIAPLTRFVLSLPLGTDLRSSDRLTVTGGAAGTYVVTSTNSPQTYGAVLTAEAIGTYDPTSGQQGLSTTTVNVLRAGTQVLAGLLVHIEPFDRRPFELMQSPENLAGTALYDSYTVFTLSLPLPDVRIRDELVDPGDADPLTGQSARYYVRRTKLWAGSHLEIEVDRVATQPTT